MNEYFRQYPEQRGNPVQMFQLPLYVSNSTDPSYTDGVCYLYIAKGSPFMQVTGMSIVRRDDQPVVDGIYMADLDPVRNFGYVFHPVPQGGLANIYGTAFVSNPSTHVDAHIHCVVRLPAKDLLIIQQPVIKTDVFPALTAIMFTVSIPRFGYECDDNTSIYEPSTLNS